MFYKVRYYQHSAFREGVRDMRSVAPGIAAWGMMTGVAMVQMGFSPWLSLLMTLFVFAGSAQLATTPLLVAGAPLWVVFLTAFCVNLRFVVFSAHMQGFLRHLPLIERLQAGYLTGDFPYVLFVKKFSAPGKDTTELEAQQAYLMGTVCVMYLSWQVSSLIGIALSSVVSQSWGLGFAGILALVGLLAGMMNTPSRVLSLCVSGFVAVMAYSLPLHLNIVVAVACSVAVCLLSQHLVSVVKPQK